jgi:hypothetical protein
MMDAVVVVKNIETNEVIGVVLIPKNEYNMPVGISTEVKYL